MELLAVRTARFLAKISTSELNPKGLLIYPSLVEGLIEKYGFTVAPGEDAVFDEEKGVPFEDGSWGKIAIDKVTIFSEAIIVDTRSSTTDSEAIFYEAMEWAANSFGITFNRDMVSRKFYVSELTIRMDASLNGLNPKLDAFNHKISQALELNAGIQARHETAAIVMHYDVSEVKMAPAPFRIERLLDARYDEGKYYAAAPLPTDDHLQLLNDFEELLRG